MGVIVTTVIAILHRAAPLACAAAGALATEYAGVLGIFMEGVITFSSFCIAFFALVWGSYWGGLGITVCVVPLCLFFVAVGTERMRANPFLTGIAVHFSAMGMSAFGASSMFARAAASAMQMDTAAHGVSFTHVSLAHTRVLPHPLWGTAVAFALVWVFHLYLYSTNVGINFMHSGEGALALQVRGTDAARYRMVSWAVAGVCAVCAGGLLVLRVGTYTPQMAAGRGWTALAIVFLARKRMMWCVPAAIFFSGIEHMCDVLQGTHVVPTGVLFALPYILSLVVFVCTRRTSPCRRGERRRSRLLFAYLQRVTCA